MIDKADYSPRWLDLFNESLPPYKQPFSSLLELKKPGHPKLPLYHIVKDSPIFGEVAFRICAIREAFEEAGVLLVRDQSDVARTIDFLPGTFSPAVKVLPESLLKEWRERVHSNAEEFLVMCK